MLYNKNMKDKKPKRQKKLDDFLTTFSENNKQIKKTLKLFDISNTQYKQAVNPVVKVTPDNSTKFTSFDLRGY